MWCVYMHAHACVEVCIVAPLWWLAQNSLAWDKQEDVREYVEFVGSEKVYTVSVNKTMKPANP